VGGEEGTEVGGEELATIITLHTTYGGAELSGDEHKEMLERSGSVRFITQGKHPRKMRIIIKDHEIIFVSRETNYRRGP
jgi:hypothetical protein